MKSVLSYEQRNTLLQLCQYRILNIFLKVNAPGGVHKVLQAHQ